MRRPAARRILARRTAALGLLAALAAGILLTGPGTSVLFLGPILLLLAPLCAGRYLGERSLRRISRAGCRTPARCSPETVPADRRPAPCVLPRGGRLLGCALAVRPPPAPA